ncbi:MAG: hypothetical protein V8S08_04700 [Lachnoclostridium sp.]
MLKKIKRIVSMLLAVCMIASFVPLNAHAMVGALTEDFVWPTNPSAIQEAIYQKYQVYWIESEYIRMYLLIGTDSAKDKHTYLVTVPNLTKASAKEAYDMVFTKGVYERPILRPTLRRSPMIAGRLKPQMTTPGSRSVIRSNPIRKLKNCHKSIPIP